MSHEPCTTCSYAKQTKLLLDQQVWVLPHVPQAQPQQTECLAGLHAAQTLLLPSLAREAVELVVVPKVWLESGKAVC